MKNIKEIPLIDISKTITICRQVLNSKNFFEYSLFSYVPYHLTNTEFILTNSNKILRSTTEPDIWQISNLYNNFFAVTSLFRKEQLDSNLHKEEFKVIDFYSSELSLDAIYNLLREILYSIENEFYFPNLSKKNFISIDYDTFLKLDYQLYDQNVIKVIDYPITESFYDAINPSNNKTYKSELFFIYENIPIEFSVFGKVAANQNPLVKLASDTEYLSNVHIDLFGMCIGIERLLFIYNKMNK